MIEKKNCRQIGVIVKTHGINGEMVLRLFEEFSIDDLPAEFLFLDIDGGLVPFFMEEAREKNQTDVLVKLESIQGDEANRYVDSPVYVETKDLPEQSTESFSVYQLIGYKAYDVNNGFMGELEAIREITNNNLFEIVHQGKEYLIPITEDFIKGIDDEKREILFDLPEGLLQLED